MFMGKELVSPFQNLLSGSALSGREPCSLMWFHLILCEG